jgi:hypothetical protein
MMQISLPENAGQVRVVQGHDLETLTSQGWRLIFAYQETTHVPCTEQDPSPNPNCYGGTVQLTRYRPNSTTFFVLHRTENKIMDELNAKVTEANRRYTEVWREKETGLKDLVEMKRKLDEQKRIVDSAEKNQRDAIEERNRFRTSATKLEGDLTKIRKAIGERALNEILPPEPPKA